MKDFTSGKESRLIFNFALPMLIGNVFQQLYQVTDSAIVGRFIGTEALSAVGNSMPVIFLLIALMIGIGIGFTVIISQYFGAKNFTGIKRATDTMFVVMFFASIILSMVGIILSESILNMVGISSVALPLAKKYMIIFLSGLVFLFGFQGISAVLRGIGDSVTPLYFLIISNIVNIILSFLFVAVLHWGIGGAAWATVIAQGMTFVAGLYYLNKSHPIIKFSLSDRQFDRKIFSRSIQIGLPTGIQQTFVAAGMMALYGIVNRFGDQAAAAYRAAGNIDSLAILPAMNFAAALSSFVGQNIGANRLDRVTRGFRVTLMMSSVTCIILSVIIIIFGRSMMRIFSTDPEVIRLGREYLVIVTTFYLSFNAMFTVNGFLRGAGDTFIPMIITLFSLWIVRIPAAFILSRYFDETGIWWAIPIGWVFGTVLSLAYLSTGRWKKKAAVEASYEIHEIELDIPID